MDVMVASAVLIGESTEVQYNCTENIAKFGMSVSSSIIRTPHHGEFSFINIV